MKKLIATVLLISTLVCWVSCSETVIDINNISNYVFVDVSFGELNVQEAIDKKEEYYLTCLATITVKPKGDFLFKDATVSCTIDKKYTAGGKHHLWKVICESESIFSIVGKEIPLDYKGYGETTLLLYCYADDYEKYYHPSIYSWNLNIRKASGTVTSNS